MESFLKMVDIGIAALGWKIRGSPTVKEVHIRPLLECELIPREGYIQLGLDADFLHRMLERAGRYIKWELRSVEVEDRNLRVEYSLMGTDERNTLRFKD